MKWYQLIDVGPVDQFWNNELLTVDNPFAQPEWQQYEGLTVCESEIIRWPNANVIALKWGPTVDGAPPRPDGTLHRLLTTNNLMEISCSPFRTYEPDDTHPANLY